MTIADELVSIQAGARFLRADLHIHSYGGSHDVSDSSMTPEGIVDRAVAEGLSIIAITDHNEITNVSRALTASKGKQLLVVPGVELSTPQGHLLVYFESHADLEAFYGKLALADRGKKDSRCQTAVLECLNQIDSAKGFGILAHLDGEGGFETVVPGFPPHKSDVIAHSSLLGIELRSISSPISYSDQDPEPQRVEIGKKRLVALSLGQKQHLARVLFSDSHSMDFLGRNAQGKQKLTRIKMDAFSFNGVRIALQDADARIRLEDEIPQSVPYLLGIKMEGGFLDGQSIHFSRNLNCIIGGRGAGKSTAFEAARIIAPTASGNRLIDSEVWPERIGLVWVDQAGQQHTIIRRIGEEAENTDDPLLGSVTFPVESYGQSETAETSAKAQQDPAVLLQYLDQFTHVAEIASREEEIRGQLLSNQSDIEKAQEQVSLIPQYRKFLANAEAQLRALEAANASEVVSLERKVAEERAIREGIEKRISDLAAEVRSSSLAEILSDIQSAAKPEELKVGSAEFREITKLVKAFASDAEKVRGEISTKSKLLTTGIKEQVDRWKAREQQILAEIEKKKKDLLSKGIKLDSMYIKKLAADEANYKKNLKVLAQWEKNLRELQKVRLELIMKRLELKTSTFKRRMAFAVRANKALKNALTDLFVNVKFVEGSLSSEAEEIIKEALGWRTSQVPRAALLVEQIPMPQLLEVIKKNDPSQIVKIVAPDGSQPFSRNDALGILKALSLPPCIYRLERCIFEDRPKITVTKKVIQKSGAIQYPSRDFSKLSLGQQQSVLLALMLCSDSNSPLLIDQPEDNLDSEFIFHSLVPVLRAAKERRQIIVVTHNPNIAVLGDAEQIVALKSTSDKSIVVARGSIDDLSTKKLVCQILEGAEEAFRRRAKMYGVI
jgi:energy-coupling factor transporter ATP-binding protein EcfA2